MSFDNDNASAAPLFIELRPGMRKALADAVDAFLNLLDQIDAVRTRRTGPKELATTARTKASCLSRPAMRSQRSARRPPSISNMLGPRLAWPMRSTKPSRRSAGRAMGAAIPRWRCAAMTTIGRGLQAARRRRGRQRQRRAGRRLYGLLVQFAAPARRQWHGAETMPMTDLSNVKARPCERLGASSRAPSAAPSRRTICGEG